MKQPERTPSESERWIALLSRAGPFSLLSRVELEDLADGFTWFSAPGGQTLFSEGDFSDEIFIVVTGSLAAYVRLPDGGERFVGRIESGHPVGEMGVIVIHETFLHVDGGVVNNLPVDTMREIGAGPSLRSTSAPMRGSLLIRVVPPPRHTSRTLDLPIALARRHRERRRESGRSSLSIRRAAPTVVAVGRPPQLASV